MLAAFDWSAAVHPIGSALVHFLWQGAALGLLTAAALRLARRASANVRYALACGGMLAMALAAAATMMSHTGASTSAAAVTVAGPTTVAVQPPAVRAATDVVPLTTTVETARPGPELLEAWLPTIVVLWLTGVLFMTLRLAAAWVRIRSLVRNARRMTPALSRAIDRVKAGLGCPRAVRAAESDVIEVPTVVGWLRPVVLMPIAVVAELTPTQLDAIVAHEIAHIRRYDHVVNGLQTFVETVLFYHPAVWWVSREMRREREHCCDDIALSVAGDGLLYATTLTALEERRERSAAWTIAATDGDLLARVQRILGVPMTRSHDSAAWSSAVVFLGVVGLFATLIASQPAPAPIDEPPTLAAVPSADLPTPLQRIAAVPAPARATSPQAQAAPSAPVQPTTVVSSSASENTARGPQLASSATPVSTNSTVRVLDDASGLNRIPRLTTANKVAAFKAPTSTIREALRSIADSGNLVVTYDQGMDTALARPHGIELQGPFAIDDALNKLFTPHSLAYKVLDTRTIFVYLDTPANRQKYEDQFIQAFKLNTDPTVMMGIIRQLLAGLAIPIAPQLSANPETRTMYVRANEGTLRLIGDFIRVNDAKPQP